MKRLLLILSVFVCGLLHAHATDMALNLMMNDGSVHSFQLSATPIITMANDKFTITTDNETVSYDLYTVVQYTFGTPTSIDSEKAGTEGVVRNGDILIFNGVGDVHKVCVSRINGALVNASTSVSGGDVTVSLASLPADIYIVKVNNISIKIVKR